jgi:small subunit ribosomal protein S5
MSEEVAEKKTYNKNIQKKDNSAHENFQEFEERVVSVARVAKVVKGGRRFSFSTLIVVGDKKGRVGFALGKAKEVPDAIKKASQIAVKKMIKVDLDKGTFPFETIGRFGAGKIVFKPAGEGTGIKAGGPCRAILELVGVKNILTKSLRGTNPHNIVRATFDALKRMKSVEEIARIREVSPKGLRLKSKVSR